MRDTFTFATFLVHQVKASRTQTLVPDLEVVANMGAASIVIQALVGACGWTERLITFLDSQQLANTLDKSALVHLQMTNHSQLTALPEGLIRPVPAIPPLVAHPLHADTLPTAALKSGRTLAVGCCYGQMEVRYFSTYRPELKMGCWQPGQKE